MEPSFRNFFQKERKVPASLSAMMLTMERDIKSLRENPRREQAEEFASRHRPESSARMVLSVVIEKNFLYLSSENRSCFVFFAEAGAEMVRDGFPERGEEAAGPRFVCAEDCSRERFMQYSGRRAPSLNKTTKRGKVDG